jgi:hypothetical protein
MSLGKSKHPGRAPISGPGETRVGKSYKLPPTTIAQIETIADERGISNTEAIVFVFGHYMTERAKPKQPEPD